MQRTVDVVVFDLGGVLAEFGGIERMRQLSGIASEEEIWRRWLTCDWVCRFERGECPPPDFAAGLVSEWNLPLTGDEFLAEFREWLVGPLPGAEELVRGLSGHVTVACLSNTNAVHWEAGAASWPLLQLFDHEFLSFRMGLVKPDREAFEHVVAALGCPARRVLYLDDNALNVEAAGAVGLRAVRVRGVAEARSAAAAAGVSAG